MFSRPRRTGFRILPVVRRSRFAGSVAPSGAAFPLSYNDPVFTGMSDLAGYPNYVVGNDEVISNKQVALDNSGTWTIYMQNSCTLNYVRMVTREGPRENGSANAVHTLNWCYIEVYNVPGDHADGIQLYLPSATPKPTLRLRNCHIRVTGGAHAGLFGADGSRCFVDLEDVLFSSDGTGQNGLKLFDDIGGGAITLRMKNVYFTQNFQVSDIYINNSSGTNPVTVTLWDNVRECTLSGSTFTPGAAISQPSGT